VGSGSLLQKVKGTPQHKSTDSPHRPRQSAGSTSNAWQEIPAYKLLSTSTENGQATAFRVVTGNALAIDMSAYGRPAAKGAILDISDIWANFEDDNVYTGKLVPPNEIVWSNKSAWTKA
jgi:hypothetical protein